MTIRPTAVRETLGAQRRGLTDPRTVLGEVDYLPVDPLDIFDEFVELTGHVITEQFAERSMISTEFSRHRQQSLPDAVRRGARPRLVPTTNQQSPP